MLPRPTDLDARVRLVWKAATWLQLGKVDPALGLLETLAGTDPGHPGDEWTAGVVRGTRLLRAAETERHRAVEAMFRRDVEAATCHWTTASAACGEALGAASLGLTHQSGSIVLALPDPWLHVVDAFQEHLDRERRRCSEGLAGGPAAGVLQFKRPGA